MLGKNEGRRSSEKQSMRWWDGITDSRHTSLRKFKEIMQDRGGWQAAAHGVAMSWTWPSKNF